MRMILTACKRGAAAVVVTHDAQVASWADRVVFLRDGTITNGTFPRAGRRSATAVRLASMTMTSVVHPPVDQADGITVRMPSPPVGVSASDGTSRTR